MKSPYVFLGALLILSVPILAAGKDEPREKIALPGLAVSIGMSVDEVAQQLQHFNFRHIPEKRWQKNGHSFVAPEEISCSAVSLAPLNEHLESLHFIFENYLLMEVSLTIIDRHNAIKPLVDALDLVEEKPGIYRGLKGKIVMRAGSGNAEKTTWTIARNE